LLRSSTWAIDPNRASLAVVAQQRQIARTLLGHQHVAVGQYEQAPWIGETGRERRRGETRWDLQGLPVKGHGQRAVGGDRPGLRCRQVVGIFLQPPADLVLDREILRQQREPLGKAYGSINRT
jgi:hypothetical protein